MSPFSQARYGSYPNTPRSILSAGFPLSAQPSGFQNHHMASTTSYNASQNDCSHFPWPTLEVVAEMTSDGQAVTPEVHAKVEKGFFTSPTDGKWTCYRRNYFSVHCHFELHPNINNGMLHLKRNNKPEQIQAMGMRLSAAVDGANGKNIELVQHTPKRDNGPKSRIEITKVSPMPSNTRADHNTVSSHAMFPGSLSTFHSAGPYLPLQNTDDLHASPSTRAQPPLPAPYPYTSSAVAHLPMPIQSTSHTFERVQFKQATANNGKRRASQQYFHLIVELFADVRKTGNDPPEWVKVAHRLSEKIVVRGRSPSHYQNEGQNSNGRAGSSAGGSSYNASAGATYGNLHSSGFRSGTSAYGHGLNTSGVFRERAFDFHPSPEHLSSNGSSLDSNVADQDYMTDSIMTDAHRDDFNSAEGYRYYPAMIDEHAHGNGQILSKLESTSRFSTDPGQWPVKNEVADAIAGAQWFGSLPRFPGPEPNRNFFSDMAANISL